jgi:hypothetical protein
VSFTIFGGSPSDSRSTPGGNFSDFWPTPTPQTHCENRSDLLYSLFSQQTLKLGRKREFDRFRQNTLSPNNGQRGKKFWRRTNVFSGRFTSLWPQKTQVVATQFFFGSPHSINFFLPTLGSRSPKKGYPHLHKILPTCWQDGLVRETCWTCRQVFSFRSIPAPEKGAESVFCVSPKFGVPQIDRVTGKPSPKYEYGQSMMSAIEIRHHFRPTTIPAGTVSRRKSRKSLSGGNTNSPLAKKVDPITFWNFFYRFLDSPSYLFHCHLRTNCSVFEHWGVKVGGAPPPHFLADFGEIPNLASEIPLCLPTKFGDDRCINTAYRHQEVKKFEGFHPRPL